MTQPRRPPTSTRPKAATRSILAIAAVWLLACSTVLARQTMLHPAGEGGARIAGLMTPVLLVFGAITVLMWALVFYAALRRTGSFQSHVPVDGSEGAGRPWLILGGIVFPVVTLGTILVVSFRTLGSFPPAIGNPAVTVVGHQWWWEIRYHRNNGDVVSANELHIPVGRPIDLELESHDVIHSFWVPALHGKEDLVPGMMNHLRLEADAAGTYSGQCAEYCGPQHALMRLLVDADDQYDGWLSHEAADAAPPVDDAQRRGQDLFLNHQCALCHTIRGTNAHGQVGPDLTHFGERQGLAASAYRNDIAALSAWVTHAQNLKPYSQMPDITALTGDELQDLVAYLRHLQ